MIVLVDYGMGNLKSVANAIECAGGEFKISSLPADLEAADGIIVPGVGAFPEAMLNIHKFGLAEVLVEQVGRLGKPYLGICLGMQILADEGVEFKKTPGLGLVPGRVERLQPQDKTAFKVPHMGWNTIDTHNDCPVFEGVGDSPCFYFVHSYHFKASNEYVSGVCQHGEDVVAAVWKDNIFGVQFHPEKSQGVGLRVLDNFCSLIRERS